MFSEPVICYFLDAALIIYCIVATALFFKEKYYPIQSLAAQVDGNSGGIYQELDRLKDADPYEVLEPAKEKKKVNKKKKSASSPPEEKDKDLSNSLIPNDPDPPPVSPQ